MELVRGNGWIKALAALAAINMCEVSATSLSSTESEYGQPPDAQPTVTSPVGSAGLGMESPPADQTGLPTDAQGYGYRIRLDSGASAIIPSLQSQEGTETKTIFAADGVIPEDLIQLLVAAQEVWPFYESGCPAEYSRERLNSIINAGLAGMSRKEVS